MRTRSPAVRLSTSASESGGTTSLIPSGRTVTVIDPLSGAPPSSQGCFLVAVCVALDRDGDGEARDVARVRQDVDAEGRGVAAVPLGADAEAIGSIEHLALERVESGVRIRAAQLAEERFLGQDRGLLEGSADTDPGDERRTRVRSGGPDALEDPVLHALRALARRQHLVLRPVLAAAALGHDLDAKRAAFDEIEVDDGRGVVTRVHPVER